jgi:glutaredoxin
MNGLGGARGLALTSALLLGATAILGTGGCGPKVTLTPTELEGLHQSCQKKIAEGFAVRASKSVGFTQKKPAGTPVVMYGADWCEACHVAATYFKMYGIPFVEHDVERDEKAEAAMESALESAKVETKKGLPVIDIRGTVVVGFNPCIVDAAWAG